MKLTGKHGYQTGFTLVEMMVGLVIGMLVTLVIVQVLSVFEAQKRSSTGSADAQTNGSIALYKISREMQNAGYPLMPYANSALECGKNGEVYREGTSISWKDISPVTIVDGGSTGGSDTITIRYGTNSAGGVPTIIGASPVGNVITLGSLDSPGSNLGCAVNDISLIVSTTHCAFSTVKALSSATTPPTITLANVTAAKAEANLACLGSWNEVVYAVSSGKLQRAGVDSIDDIVSIQAQYGTTSANLTNTNANFNQVVDWYDATAGSNWDWASGSFNLARRNRIKAIRIAIVARNAKKEISKVTAACSSLTSARPTGLCAWAGSAADPAPKIDLSLTDSNWEYYRYRVFETIIPLRNVFWAKDTL